MPNVYELTGAFNHIEHGNPLVFPNVLTCMAFAAYDGVELIGVHFTQMDQSSARISGAWLRVQAISAGPHPIYIAGPNWNANLLANLVPAPVNFHSANVPAGSDIQMSVAHGVVTVEYRPHGGAGAWVAAAMNA